MTWPFGPLKRYSYDLIMADPPWDFKTWSAKGEQKSAKAHYCCMSGREIKALPVADLAAPDAILMLWATNPMLPVAVETLSAWGFTYKTQAVWVKRTKRHKLGFGTGYILRSSHEPILIGTIGNPKTTRRCRSVVEGLLREHSRKPDEAFVWAEALVPNARRAELFSRETRPGWTHWGLEAGLFDQKSRGAQ